MSQHFLGGRSLGCLVTVMTLAGTVYSGYTMIAGTKMCITVPNEDQYTD